jgi:hypothetical protein
MNHTAHHETRYCLVVHKLISSLHSKHYRQSVMLIHGKLVPYSKWHTGHHEVQSSEPINKVKILPASCSFRSLFSLALIHIWLNVNFGILLYNTYGWFISDFQSRELSNRYRQYKQTCFFYHYTIHTLCRLESNISDFLDCWLLIFYIFYVTILRATEMSNFRL